MPESKTFNADFFSVSGSTSAGSVNGAGQYDQIKFKIDGPENVLVSGQSAGLQTSYIY